MHGRPTYGLSFCKSGQITYTMNGKQFVSAPDCAVLLPQGGHYALHGDKDGVFPVINFDCAQPLFEEIIVLPLRDAEDCLREVERMEALCLSEDRLGLFSVFYGLLKKVFTDQTVSGGALQELLRYIEANIASPELSNELLAKKLCISEVYLRKLFLRHFQTTPKQYVLDMRIRKAKQLLTDTSLSVTAISEACGFSGVYHFCRIFKQKAGVTPTRFAKEHKVYHI